LKRFIDKLQMYDGFPSLWYSCALSNCNPGISEEDWICYCGFHILLFIRGWTRPPADDDN
jgi:hypothetical protein